jgi:hypothetical protein
MIWKSLVSYQSLASVRSGAAVVLLGVLLGCQGGGEGLAAGSVTADGHGGLTATQRAIGADRPVMMVEAQRVDWGRVLPLVLDSPAGESAVRMLVLEARARQELAKTGRGLPSDRELVERERARLSGEVAASMEDGQRITGRDEAQRVLVEAARARGLGPAAMEQSMLVGGLVRELAARDGKGIGQLDETAKLRLIAAERRRREGVQVDVAIAVFASDSAAQRGLAAMRGLVNSKGTKPDVRSLQELATQEGATGWFVVQGLSLSDARMPAGMQQTIASIDDGEVGGLVPLNAFEPGTIDSLVDGTSAARVSGTAVVYRIGTRSGQIAALSNETIWQELLERDEQARVDGLIHELLRGADVLVYDRDLQRAWERQSQR